MKGSASLAFLLVTTAMAGPAEAGPVAAWLVGLGGGWGATVAVGSGIGLWGTLGLVTGRLLLSAGLSAASAAFNRGRQSDPADRLINRAQPLQPMKMVFGRVRVGGALGFSAFAAGHRHYTITMAAHRTKGVIEHWLDDVPVEIDGSGNVTTAPIAGNGNIATYRGLPGQAVDSVLDAAFPAVTASHNLAGLTYARIRAKRVSGEDFAEVYPSGQEWAYSAVLDGDDWLYDPRDGQYKWTRNLALVAAKLIVRFKQPELLYPTQTGTTGAGVPIYSVPSTTWHSGVTCLDWARVAVEADASDVTVTNGDGGAQPKWQFDADVSHDAPWESVRQVIEKAGDVWFVETMEGNVDFFVGRYIAPTLTLTDRDFLRVSVAENAHGPDVPGSFAMRYTEPGSRYQAESCADAVMDMANHRHDEDECFAIGTHNQAYRVTYRRGKKARAQYAISGTVKLIGYEAIGQRFIRITLAVPEIDVVVEVDKLQINADGVTLELGSHSVVAADFDPAVQEPPRPVRAEIASDSSVPAPASLSGAVVTATGGVAMIEWTWPVQDSAYSQQVRLKRSTDADWQYQAIASGQVALITSGLIDGATYEAQIRNRITSGKTSDWAPVAPISVQAVANTTAPGNITGFAAAVMSGDASLTWTAPNDPVYAGARIWRNNSTSFTGATLRRTEYGGIGLTDAWTESPGPGTWSYWIEPINASGIAGTRLGPETIIIP